MRNVDFGKFAVHKGESERPVFLVFLLAFWFVHN